LTVPNAEKTFFSYDNRNRPTLVNYPDGTSISYDYFADGALRAIDGDNSSWSYAYNKRRMLVEETLMLGASEYTFGHAYDEHGNLVAQRYGNGFIVEYAPNALGQPTQAGVTQSGDIATE